VKASPFFRQMVSSASRQWKPWMSTLIGMVRRSSMTILIQAFLLTS
jgi:hypothetical protein